MSDYAGLIATSSAPWLIAAALSLGALHALEPGHAKTMIAAFVVATRGTVAQAVVLGLSAALSHSLLIWVLAAAALAWGDPFIGAAAEPWLQLLSGAVIVGIGASVIWRAWRSGDGRHRHDHAHDPHHHHHDHHHHHGDAHVALHARQVARQVGGGPVGMRAVALFGFSGGLMPCPAAFTALLVCLRLKQAVLGAALVLSFSFGLAATLVAIGVLAAIGAARARRALPDMPGLAALPYVSGAVIVALGLFVLLSGPEAPG